MPGEEGGGAECVKVAVRCRPPSTKELNAGERSIVEMNEAFTPADQGTGQVILNDPNGHEEPAKFAFDIVFGLSIRQVDIYEAVGRPALMKTFEGYNGTIFAYGQTGSGKSFTMSGAEGDLRGITPRVNEELFERIAAEQVGSRRYLVMCSYFEIYNEIIFDLLNPVSDRSKLGGGLQIKEHPVMGIYVKDLTEIVSEDAQKLEAMIHNGSKARAVSSTMMNASSSRSHSIFTIKVHQKDEEDASRNVFAKLNLVDLAGSERQKGTGATGQTLKEGANINKSLSALGNVINALVECASGKKVFIPYRNSKLTRVLQESLGGNSLCTMLAMMSPAACNYDETVSTLRYANRAKAIKVSATKNEEASQISRLKAEVEELKKKLANAGTGGGPAGGVGLTEQERKEEQTKFEKQLQEMEGMLNNNWGEKAKLSEEHERKLKKIAEEARLAEQALEEERARRLRLLQEKNDLELSVRGLIDFVLHLPKFSNAPPVITGEQPRQWLKSYRSLRLLVDELKDQCTMVLVFKHAFDEDVRLWGEGAESNDMNLVSTGLTRCVPKLDKFRKGGEKLLQLQVEGLSTASSIADCVRQAITDLEKVMRDTRSEAEADPADAGKATKGAALDEVRHMLGLVQQQVQEKIEEIEKKSEIEMGQTCEIVLQFSRSCLGENGIGEQVTRDCEALQGLIADPSLAGLPASMPSKPLREYTPMDVQDTPETTEALLGQLIRWEGLCGGKTRKTALELLTRPPPKFLLDVTISVKAMTGFPAELNTEWPEAREERLQRFQQIANIVGSTLGVAIDFDPADVLKGKEVSKTLRLLQLLAVAAAKIKPNGSKAHHNTRKLGVTRPKELPAVLDSMMRCIQGVKNIIETQRQEAQTATNAEQSLEEKIASIQRQLQEEARKRLRQEEVLADAERQWQDAQAEQKKIDQECQLNQASASPDAEQLDLERQLQELKRDAPTPAEIPEEAVVRLLEQQIEEVKKSLVQDESAVFDLETQREDLERGLQAALQETKAVEAEVQRERQRREMEEELMGQSPEEQKLILEAHEQKLRMRVETLEEQIGQMQGEAAERKVCTERRIQERIELQRQVDEAQLQVQIVQEERDAMREAMEQLFNEKAAVDEELQDRQQAYIYLTERVNRINDETCELQDLLAQRMREAQRLQKNGFHMGPDTAVPDLVH
mmetsp:Transcript_77248/g.145608  ORF Transcript_77248/g.145608 Transcript_77248/m.145608 type:complete len:1180 (-) Transcript_77248:118-3657(-)